MIPIPALLNGAFEKVYPSFHERRKAIILTFIGFVKILLSIVLLAEFLFINPTRWSFLVEIVMFFLSSITILYLVRKGRLRLATYFAAIFLSLYLFIIPISSGINTFVCIYYINILAAITFLLDKRSEIIIVSLVVLLLFAASVSIFILEIVPLETDYVGVVTVLTFSILFLLATLYGFKNQSEAYEKNLEEQRVTISNQKHELEQLNELKDKFMSIIAHDIRTPLNSVHSFSTLLINHLDHIDKKQVTDMATQLKMSVRALHDLLGNLLLWSMNEANGMTMEMHEFDLAMVIRRNIELQNLEIISKQLTVKPQVPNSAMVIGNEYAIDTVVRNMLSNAVRYSRQGGNIDIYLESDATHTCVLIRDNGKGIEENVLTMLGEGQRMKPSTRKLPGKGTGLGLPLSIELLRKNNSELRVTSVPNEGTTISFKLRVSIN